MGILHSKRNRVEPLAPDTATSLRQQLSQAQRNHDVLTGQYKEAAQATTKLTRENHRLNLQVAELERESMRLRLIQGNIIPSLAPGNRRRVKGTSKDPFICPITHHIMKDPVMLVETGKSYDRDALDKWLRMSNRDPMTNTVLESKQVQANYNVRDAIRERFPDEVEGR
jgi:hypothetical protein